jgi:DNA polymerase I-like protein with 3'-5' exonuclease and polymerase domains
MTLNMVGQKPVWMNGILYSDDIYISVMSASPLFADIILALSKKTFPAGDFYTQWITDKDEIVKHIKKERGIAKALTLGLSYGMRPKKLMQTAAEAGFPITMQQAKSFYAAYWDLFAGVRLFSDKCSNEMEASGQLVNEFGYRNVCEPHKAFNGLIQSTVSGLINLYMGLLFEAMPWAEFVTVIHDEVLYQVPIDRLEEAKHMQQEVTNKLNGLIEWSTAMRTGFVAGNDFYTAK